MERRDAELIEAFRSGDGAAFEELYRRHRDWAVGLAFRITGHREDALDILQEAFAYVARRAATLDLRAGFRTFLYPVIKHRAIDRKRARRPAPRGPEPEARPAPEGSLEPYLRLLGDEHREVVDMRFADGMSLEEIAGALDVPLGTVKSRLHNALKILRRIPPNP